MRTCDIAIIGCGPAGLSAAIQLRRMGDSPLVFEAFRVGGLLLNANLVENYPGFPKGIGGPELVSRMREHLEHHSPEVILEEVTRLDIAGVGSDSDGASGSESDLRTSSGAGGFQIRTCQRDIHCRIVLIASGTKARQPDGLFIPDDVSGQVFSEVYPIMHVQGKRIAIVGSGDAAFDYALNLAGKNRVSILNRSRTARCLPLLRDRAAGIDSIEYHDRTLPVGLKNLRNSVIEVECETPGGRISIEADYVLLAIGREPRLDFITDRLSEGMEGLQRSGVLHLIGDVGRGMMRQTAIATGDGVRAAMEAHKKLMELRA
ncbi:NAD(P)/FAD-dependent oxidoreductase [Candidatus Eisenbacteria bacterium]|uniref:NAD(P)/FAD-dependent oxidoreductase n=1 Tax=Eiseniibacteriota bacterium TaxID=2212470 RepID=A0ABV6YQ98_UNCEI